MKSVRSRIVIIVLAVSVFAMSLVAVIGTTISSRTIREQALGRISETVRMKSSEVDSWLRHKIYYVSAIASGLSHYPDISPDAIYEALIAHAEHSVDFFAVFVGYYDDTAVFSDGWVPDPAQWRATERTWYIGAAADPTRAYISEVYQDAFSGQLCITVSRAFIRDGVVAGVAAIDVFTATIEDFISRSDLVGDYGYAFLADAYGNIIAHPLSDFAPYIDRNGDVVFRNLATVQGGIFAELTQWASWEDYATIVRGQDGVRRYYLAHEINETGWVVYLTVPVSVVSALINNQIWAIAIIFILVLAAVFTLAYRVAGGIGKPIAALSAYLSRLGTSGNINTPADEIAVLEKYSQVDDEIGNIIKNAGMFVDNVKVTAKDLEMVANNDLTVEVNMVSDHDTMGGSLSKVIESLNNAFGEIRTAAFEVASGSKQIANSSQVLAQGATEQFATVEALSGAISKIAQKTSTNAEMAGRAASLAGSIKKSAQDGSSQMNDMMGAVKEINDASQNISKVIKVIDDIAFQTNILALNAAVEAARAGQHGKGFAVVADEVRSLAAKSAEAAKDTELLITSSIETAKKGDRIAKETAESLVAIVDGINESSQIVSEIALSSEEQSTEIAQINEGISQVADVVAQNSAAAQESAATSEEMSSQSALLEQLLDRFKLRNDSYSGLSGIDHDAPKISTGNGSIENINAKHDYNMGKY